MKTNQRNEGPKILMTPEFQKQAMILGVPFRQALGILSNDSEPTWVVGDPTVLQYQEDDEGRTVKIPAPFRFYAIRDDHEKNCDCGCDVKRVVTFLLPEEY